MSKSAVRTKNSETRLIGYEEDEKEATIRAFLGPSGVENEPRCSHCGEVFEVRFSYESSPDVEIQVDCPGCANGFKWRQRREVGAWSPVHLRYFLERVQESATEIRCPYDDCFVSYLEYSDGRIEFRCPYCNRRSIAESSEELRQRRLTAPSDRKYSDSNNLGEIISG